MAQIKLRGAKTAAKRLGLSLDEYLAKKQQGLKWCTACRDWHPRSEFARNPAKYDGLDQSCRQSNRMENPGHPWRGGHLSKEHREKISKSLKARYQTVPHPLKGRPSPLKGRSLTLERRRRISQILRQTARRGPDCPSFKDGKVAERRGLRHSQEYKRWRYDVFLRDSFTCQRCGDNRGGNLVAHHIRPFSAYPELRFDINNGLTLCEECHGKEHSDKLR